MGQIALAHADERYQPRSVTRTWPIRDFDAAILNFAHALRGWHALVCFAVGVGGYRVGGNAVVGQISLNGIVAAR